MRNAYAGLGLVIANRTILSREKVKGASASALAPLEFGSPTWTRTRDLRINSPSLYRLSYQGIDKTAMILSLLTSVKRDCCMSAEKTITQRD